MDEKTKNELINRTVSAIRQITVPRYYRTERGFVAEFYRHLSGQLENATLFPQHTILESEVQKRTAKHYGVKQRPDILIHIPIETGLTQNANENNFVVYAFKLNGNQGKADKDYGKLNEMFNKLNYEMGIFINISAYPAIYLGGYQGNHKSKIHELSIGLQNQQILIRHSFFTNNQPVTNDL